VNTQRPSLLREVGKTALRFSRRAVENARPVRPHEALFTQGLSFEAFLLPEDTFEAPIPGFDDPVTVFLMKDGALGVGLWLSPLAHEMLSEVEIKARLTKLSDAVVHASRKGKVPGLSFQLIYDCEPDAGDTEPGFTRSPSTTAQTMAQNRFEALSTFAHTPRYGMRLVRRRYLLTVRLAGEHPLRAAGAELEDASRKFARRQRALSDAVSIVVATLQEAFSPRVMTREELLFFLRDSLHSLASRRGSPVQHRLVPSNTRPLAEQSLYQAIEATPFGVGVGKDCWQVASLLEAPESTSLGVLSRLLSLKAAHRIVVNFRACEPGADLSMKRMFLAYATDPVGVHQREDLDGVTTRVQGEESLCVFSWHILVRNEGVPLAALADSNAPADGALPGVLSEVTAALSGRVAAETLCAPLVFAACLPFQNETKLMALLGREVQGLSRTVVSLLPVFGGFPGSPTPMVQMMNRAGERVFLNPRDAQGASHVAILGGSGGGKSFFTANLIQSFRAAHADARVFIIDKKTSYGVLARLAAEESSATFLRPPQSFPNIFQGCDNEDELGAVVGLLRTAIMLMTPKAEVGATHLRVLSDAIKMTFAEKIRQASSVFEAETGEVREASGARIVLPRLSDVVTNLHEACDALAFPSATASTLGEWLSPFYGGGPYARFFDAEGVFDANVNAPAFTLCDLDGVSNDPILMVLTVQAVILDILRLVRPRSGVAANPPSLLLIEEVGVLAGESEAIVSFIRDAWKTLRKYDVTCIGVTNTVTDYADHAGPREIWNNSSNKVILPQNITAVMDMETRLREGRNGLVPSLSHCEVLRSLVISKGEFADGLWLSDRTEGTFTYVPTGFDYWCAASNPVELDTITAVERSLVGVSIRPLAAAIETLALLYPGGVRADRNVRPLTSAEHDAVTAHARTRCAPEAVV
jgi:hypothetical protein